MLFTIGYSTRSFAGFLNELSANGVTNIVDVRSSPRSRNPEFNRQRLVSAAELLNLKYSWEGQVLGGLSALSPGHAPYELALQQLVKSSVEENVAVFCAEGDPEKCHRCYDIGAALLFRYGLHSQNIRRDGAVEDVLVSLGRLRGAKRETVRRSALAWQGEPLSQL